MNDTMQEQLIQAFNLFSQYAQWFGATVTAPEKIEESLLWRSFERILNGTATENDIDFCQAVFGIFGDDAGFFHPAIDAIDRARLALLGEDAITIIECAGEFGLSQQAVSAALNTKRLTTYRNPDAPQRQGSRLVSRYEAATLWQK